PRIEATHSGEGARAIAGMGAFGGVLAGTIAGHHGRLPRSERLKERIAAAEELVLPDWAACPLPAPPDRLLAAAEGRPYRTQFLVRMLYGCLTDADDRETAAFYDEAEGRVRTPREETLTDDMLARFDAHMDELGGTGSLNELRRGILDRARVAAAEAPGLFTMTVPTGGGKTLAALGFALEHARAHGLRRVINVIPYTSIVEQTADVLRGVLGNGAVLEHHSAADWDGEDESEAEQRKVAAASWDVPVVVTTAVQFFESLHAARKKRCRKLHSLAGAVIVLDEAQTLPLPLLRPCLAALTELMEGYGATVVLSTATQPALTTHDGFPAPEALSGAREIAPDPVRLYETLRRVRVRDVGAMDQAALAERMRGADQALCIVDSRAQARGLFDTMSDAPGRRHLSTLMTPAHRRAVLAEVRADLKAGAPVRLVSTSLIEAGVDVDFPLVLRAMSGIDRIAQAAGRCNREGKLEENGVKLLGEVEVFHPETNPPEAMRPFVEVGREIMATHATDPIGLDAVKAYFKLLWERYGAEALDSVEVGGNGGTTGILAAIDRAGLGGCPYPDIEAAFRIVPDGQNTLAIRGGPWGIGETTLKDLRHRSPGAAAKALAPYSVDVPHAVWRSLWDAGIIEWWERGPFGEQFAMMAADPHYSSEAGLGIRQHDELGSQIF
ncbi:MAG: DEAD/DEAH box helicase, partial [Litorimonas sp.]